jgi:ABC-2 type transport system ATP-binding protein
MTSPETGVPMTASAAIQADQLRKAYGTRLALDSVSLEVKAGEIAGLLGPNGAGKTTTLSILATLMRPDSGSVHILGLDSAREEAAIRSRLGLVPQSIALYPSLSAMQNLELFLRVHRYSSTAARERALQALDSVGLVERANDIVSSLSGGMKRRLNLACGIAHRPDVLLLDEPTAGVDPQSREQILHTIRQLAEFGSSVVYSTHYMEEVERICDRVFLIDRGRLVASGTVSEVIATAGGRPRMEFTFAGSTPPRWYEGIEGVEAIPSTASAGHVALRLHNLGVVPQLLERARTMPGGVHEFSIHSPNLSDAFMAITGHELRDDDAG